MDPITLRRWRGLTYHDPAEKLRQYRAVEIEIATVVAGQDLEPGARKALALRTHELSRFLELRDGALFTLGMGLAMRQRIGIADEEDVDYDFVTVRVDGDTAHYCPVQLKELPPDERNPHATVEGLLAALPKRYAPTETVLVVRLNHAGHVILDRDWPAVPFAQLWFLWASAPDASKWSIYGDALANGPGQWAFDYPT